MTKISNNEADTLQIDAQFNFDENSLIQIAVAVESELTGINVKEFEDDLNLQHIVIKSKLAGFAEADRAKLHKLLDILYQQQDFKGDWKAFFKVKNALLSKVLARRKGIPISLGVLALDFLNECGFDAHGICFPSGFIIRINLQNEVVYLDPFTGELPSWELLELKVRGQLGNHARLTLDMLNPDDNKTIIMRLVNVIKAAYIQADELELALLCCDILLRIEPEDAYEVRDRGFLFQQLECFNLARTDFEFFIEQYPKDPIVNLLKQQIEQMNLDTNIQVIH
ncbi:SirB1 family protein [Psychromonas ossibalaenae]|uniref:SirB1 family protein n=1 Tax=Psychromonas ossibalaenae TaxID=444922 RepID=UPI000372EED3|nr:tetratricopeptide repeat protein [Psychromonas ossibalaenae]